MGHVCHQLQSLHAAAARPTRASSRLANARAHPNRLLRRGHHAAVEALCRLHKNDLVHLLLRAHERSCRHNTIGVTPGVRPPRRARGPRRPPPPRGVCRSRSAQASCSPTAGCPAARPLHTAAGSGTPPRGRRRSRRGRRSAEWAWGGRSGLQGHKQRSCQAAARGCMAAHAPRRPALERRAPSAHLDAHFELAPPLLCQLKRRLVQDALGVVERRMQVEHHLLGGHAQWAAAAAAELGGTTCARPQKTCGANCGTGKRTCSGLERVAEQVCNAAQQMFSCSPFGSCGRGPRC